MNQTDAAAPLLSIRGLTKAYGEGNRLITAVDHIDLDVPPGEVLLVMGPSGSGKTTLLLMLGALLRPCEGAITVTTGTGTVDVARARERELPTLRARTFGFIFQDYALIDALSAHDNIAVAANLAGTTGPAATSRAHELLERVGLGPRGTARPTQLSGGEQQRVAVARALANNPPILLADEPTANLDSARGRDLARLLRDLAKQDGRAAIIVSHDDRLREIADRVLWLEDGRFRELQAMVIDPVCRMPVEPLGPNIRTAGGELKWFCSEGCKSEFLASPERFP